MDNFIGKAAGIFIALCGVGLEKVVSNELRKLGLRVSDSGHGRVRFMADIPGCYRALMGLRAADRVLWEAARFPARDFDALFEGIRGAPWEGFIPDGMGLKVVKVRVNRSRLRGLTSIQGMVHKAAAGRLCDYYRRHRLSDEGLQAELRVYIEKDEALALLDLSGEPLFKRGYRSEGGIAPLRETTAAALLFLANWRRKFSLYDPFCGSGTILIEAALYAWDMAPGLGRSFVLSDMAPGDREIEERVRVELREKVDFTRTIRIYGSDADPRAVSIAQSNLARAYDLARRRVPKKGIREPPVSAAGPEPGLPELRVLPMQQAKAPLPAVPELPEPGCIITNPPYGVRLGEPETAEATYREMEELAGHFPGWKLAVLTGHPGFESHFGRKADSCREITNGAIGSYFFQYEKL
ncbi:MAG: class I SAM-dependent RNA methyltransferase [Spirochaetaceae bacterium]|jgi:putative N6-adenine-specific DNA methylase|nr:class I SAM-dependent RNA methyltransferase [Spirochaetaceae bacterium]